MESTEIAEHIFEEKPSDDRAPETKKELKQIQVCRLTQGTNLDLSGQKLLEIPLEVLKFRHLQTLYLEGNQITQLSENFAESLNNLTWLDLRHNLLASLPSNVSLLKDLKNLLLEGNRIKELPKELGHLSKLTGLNLKGNPLEFPPKNILQQGTKVILKYLRNQYLYKEEKTPFFLEDEKEPKDDMDILPSDEYLNNMAGGMRRLKLTSAPVQRKTKKKDSPSVNSGSGYMRKEPISLCHQRLVEDAKMRTFNQETDAILQGRRNKSALNDWRKETAKLQRLRRFAHSAEHKMTMPYGNDLSGSTQEEADVDSDMLYENLDEKIKEHVQNIKEWRSKIQGQLTIEEEVKATKKNLEMAQQYQKDLERMKTTKYKL